VTSSAFASPLDLVLFKTLKKQFDVPAFVQAHRGSTSRRHAYYYRYHNISLFDLLNLLATQHAIANGQIGDCRVMSKILHDCVQANSVGVDLLKNNSSTFESWLRRKPIELCNKFAKKLAAFSRAANEDSD
jgi:hypothetical protein